jgi:hypothetical protein
MMEFFIREWSEVYPRDPSYPGETFGRRYYFVFADGTETMSGWLRPAVAEEMKRRLSGAIDARPGEGLAEAFRRAGS